jgi:hypothetical protein
VRQEQTVEQMNQCGGNNIDPYRFRDYRLLDTKGNERYGYGVKSAPKKEDACIRAGFTVEIP